MKYVKMIKWYAECLLIGGDDVLIGRTTTLPPDMQSVLDEIWWNQSEPVFWYCNASSLCEASSVFRALFSGGRRKHSENMTRLAGRSNCSESIRCVPRGWRGASKQIRPEGAGKIWWPDTQYGLSWYDVSVYQMWHSGHYLTWLDHDMTWCDTMWHDDVTVWWM